MNPPVYHFCTYFDVNYLTRGLALYDSLRRHCRSPFVLWVLCFDDVTRDVLERLNLSRVRVITYSEFEQGDTLLQAAKQERGRVEYFWTCTPSLPLFILTRYRDVETITYIDADLCFYSDPAPLFEEMGDASIAIIPHRFSKGLEYLAAKSGAYNVGWLSFRRDDRALACLEVWRGQCLDWCFARYEDGKFGDQLYLDDWPQRFEGVVVLQHPGANVGPWNVARYQVARQRKVTTVDDVPLLFYHFHALQEVAPRYFIPVTNDAYQFDPAVLRLLYIPYAAKLACFRHGLALGIHNDTESLRSQIVGLFTRRYVLTKPQWLAFLIWWYSARPVLSQTHLEQAYTARIRGDLRVMRRHLVRAMGHDVRLMRNLGIWSMLFESWIGSRWMSRFRDWNRSVRNI